MEDPQNDYESVRWERPSRDQEQTQSSLPERPKANQSERRQDSHLGSQPDHTADRVDLAGITSEGFLICTVEKPQKENEGTKDVYVSYLISTHSDFKTFAKDTFSVRRRFTDFRYLYKALCNQYPHIAVPPLPDKHNLEYIRGDRFGPDFTLRRAHSLHRFIKRIALHSVLRRNATFLSFLETPDWNAIMRGTSRDRGGSFGDPGASSLSMSSSTSGTSAIDRFQDWSINFLKAPHKADKRFIAVKEKADKFEEDLLNVEKGVAKVVRREGDLESDYQDLAAQMQKLVNLEPGIGSALTSFAASVEATSAATRDLKNATDQDYMESLRDMASYTTSMKSLLKERNQKQLDFEALTEYLQKATTDRDTLASERGPPSLTSSPARFVQSKLEDVRGVDHEQSRRDRLRRSEMKIEDLNRAVDEAKNTSEAFDDQVIKESAEFERIKAVEFKDTLGGLADAEMQFWKSVIGTWEEFMKQMETGETQPSLLYPFFYLQISITSDKNQPKVSMLEARLDQAEILKKVVDSIRDLVQDCNFDCNDSGIALQAMDNSHVALVSMLMSASQFSPYRCDRNIALGINLNSLTKVLRAAQNDDILTLKAEDAPDSVNLTFESASSDRVSEYDIKLMDIDQEHLGIPETQYAATISMPSSEFQRICRDLMALSESVSIECTKEGVSFKCTGDIGNGSVTLRSSSSVDDPKKNIEIALSEPVALTFSLKYLVNFCKASGLDNRVKLCLSNEVPLLVEYGLSGENSSGSYLRFYLAPKIGDEE